MVVAKATTPSRPLCTSERSGVVGSVVALMSIQIRLLDMSDLMFRPVDELAGMVRSGELSSRELVQESLDRIDELNPQLNAFVDVFADEALAAADAVGQGDDRPYAGVPIAIKNNRAVAGKRLTMAANFMGDFTPNHDDNVVRRLKEAGFVVVGTTTLPEWGIVPVTDTKRFGTT